MIMSAPKPQLTQTIMNTLFGCGIKMQRKYGERFGIWDSAEPEPMGIAAAVGIAVHHSVEHDMRNKMTFGAQLSPEQCGLLAVEKVQELFTFGVMLTDEESKNFDETRAAAMSLANRIAQFHNTDVGPTIDPIAVEQPFSIDVVGQPFELGGKIDLIDRSGIIIDTKTSDKNPGEGAARTLQTGIYALSYSVAHDGKLPDLIRCNYLVHGKKGIRLEVRECVPDQQLIDFVLARFESAVNLIVSAQKGNVALTPADLRGWVCTKDYCGFAKTCRYWSGK